MSTPGAGPLAMVDPIASCAGEMAGFEVPWTVVFAGLSKIAAGKIEKFVLRERAKALGEASG
jgi:fatty-acyl-CoA synthase